MRPCPVTPKQEVPLATKLGACSKLVVEAAYQSRISKAVDLLTFAETDYRLRVCSDCEVAT